MNIRKLIYLIVALFATALLWGCGSSGGGGSDFVGQQNVAPEYLGNANCLTCHDGVHTNDPNSLTEGKLSHLAGIIDTDAALINNSWYIAHACEDCHGGGSAHRGIGPIPFPQPDLARCATCHNDAATKLVDAQHNQRGNANLEAGSFATSDNCRACHTVEGFIDVSAQIDFVHGGTDHTITCAACHDPLTMELRTVGGELSCSQCHTGIGLGSTIPGTTEDIRNHLKNKPFSDEIYQRFVDGRHTGRARDSSGGNCAGCHSHEGGILLLSQTEKINTIGQVDALQNEFAALGGDLNVKTCATCHDPHSGNLRGIGDVIESIDEGTSTGPADRVVFSSEYNLCTSCHQANIDFEFVDTIGYNEGGMFEYSLSDAYRHDNDPYGNPSNIGFHSDSYQDRSFFDTHFNGLISKDLYYYDISDKEDRNGYTGVDKARRDRNGVLIVTDDMTDAITMLEDYYQAYLDAPVDIQVNGYGVNPGSSNACSSCHDVHSANKIEGTAALIKADATGEAVGHIIMAEPSMQQAVAYGEGVGMSHNDYIANAFSREADFGSCVPCHTGREFVSLTVIDGEPEAARWNSVGCVSCHDMVDTEGVVLTEARTFPDSYVFEFNSGAVLTAEQQLGDNQVCFECHKGRNEYDNDPTVATVYGINYLHYSPSFATMMGTESEMIPTYDDKDYTTGLTLDLAYDAHASSYNNCVACHNIHEEYAPFSSFSQTQYGREEFDSSLTTNLCGSCHYETDFTVENYWRSFNVLKKRTEVFADVLKSTITDELATLVNANNDAAIIIEGVDGAHVTLVEDRAEYVDVFGGEAYAADITDEAIAKRLKTYITGSTRDITGSRLVNNNLAKAGAIWKNFMYDDRGWAHNSILARQLMYDATVNVGGTAALTKFCAYITAPDATTIGVQIDTEASGYNVNKYGSLTRNLDAGTSLRPIVCP